MTFLGIAPGVLNSGKGLDAELDLVVESGADGIRALAQWPDLEPTVGGKLDLSGYMKIVEGCEKRGLGLSSGLSGRDGRTFDAGPEYARTASNLAINLEGRAKFFEFPNEPDHFKCDSNPTPARYMELHLRAYDACKTAAPRLLYGNGGLGGMQADGKWVATPITGNKLTAADFWKGCYDHGLKGHVDVAMFHPYSQPGTFSESVLAMSGGAYLLKLSRKISVDRGDKLLPWVLTEFGWQTAGFRNPISERDQAARLADAYTWIARRPWIIAAFWFNLQDKEDADPTNTGSWMGLFHKDGTPKDSAAVFKALAALEDAA